MQYLMDDAPRALLEPLAAARSLLAFDFDGTLAPIVSMRDSAFMRESTRALFEAVCHHYPCAVISGRSVADVITRLGDARVKYVVGNHGLEPGGDLAGCAADVAEVRPLLVQALAAASGVEVEDKHYSLAVHYRAASDKRRARVAIRRAIATLPAAMRVVAGKLVVNVVPARAPDKGHALYTLMAQEQAERALFIGDDVTDEDVFRQATDGRVLTIRIGESKRSAAAYYLRDQGEMDLLLRTLIELRR